MEQGATTGQGVPSIVLRVAGAVLLAAPLIPLVLWGNPYPAAATRYWGLGAGLTLLVAALAAYVPPLRRVLTVEPLLRAARALPSRSFAALIALAASLLAAWFAWGVFRFGASTTDELAQLWHARILHTGHWALPVDPDRAFFALDTVVDGDRWFSQFPIGGPMLLALGSVVGAPWLVNTLATGLIAAATYGFARRAYGEGEARLIAVVMALAPSIAMMGGTMMNHTPVLLLWTIVLWMLTGWDSARRARDGALQALGIGVALGLMATIRPLDAVVAALATAGFQLAVFRRAPRRAAEWLAQGAGGVLGVSPLFVAHANTTGHWLRFAYDLQWGPGHNLGFHVDPYGKPFTLAQGLEHGLTYLGELAMFVTAWPVPSLALVAATLLLLRRGSRWDALLLGHFALQLAVHMAYWGRGEFLGPRFLFTALPTLVVFIARLPQALGARIADRWRPAVPVAFAAMLVMSWLAPVEFLGVRGLIQIAARARGALRADVADAVRSARIDRGVVFLREPFSARLTRRLWGLGLRRDETARLLASHDACAIHDAVAQFEGAPPQPPSVIRGVLSATPRMLPSDSAMGSTDGVLGLNGPGSLTPACKAEFEADTTGGFVAFGVGLPLEPIDQAGRVSGPVVYAADLGPVNGRLARRFGDRPWYVAVSRGRGVELEKIQVPEPTAVNSPPTTKNPKP